MVVPELQRRGLFRDRYTGIDPARPPRPGPARRSCSCLKRAARWTALRVVEAATLAAGPMAATALGEFGAEIIKVEQPGTGDPMRTWGNRRDGIGLVWKSVSRNKRCVTLDLRQTGGPGAVPPAARPERRADRRQPAERARAVGHRLRSRCTPPTPTIVMLHVTGYGKGGPASDRPGYGTLAEAMSGFAHLTGQPDGPPTLPPFMLADGVASLAATYAVMMALYHRDVHGGTGQLVDVNLIEPLARLMESNTLVYDQLGIVLRAGRQPPRRQRAAQRLPHLRRSLAGRSRARRRTSRCASTGRSGAPTWPRTPTTSTRSADWTAPARSTSSWPTGSANGRSTRPWRRSSRPRSPPRRSTTPSSCSPTSTSVPAARSSTVVDDRPRTDGGAGAGRGAQRDSGSHRPPRRRPRRRQRRGVRRPARPRRRATRRPTRAVI